MAENKGNEIYTRPSSVASISSCLIGIEDWYKLMWREGGQSAQPEPEGIQKRVETIPRGGVKI